MNIRDATVEDVPMMARVPGDWCNDTPWMPALHSRAEDGGGMGFLAPEVRALLADVKAVGPVRLWTFQANTLARAVYLREGFREVRRTDGRGSDEKLPDVLMEWRG